jgi:hypothetical protein
MFEPSTVHHEEKSTDVSAAALQKLITIAVKSANMREQMLA